MSIKITTDPLELDFIDYLNESGIPEHELESEGGRIPDHCHYGNWLYQNDPIAFNVALQDFK